MKTIIIAFSIGAVLVRFLFGCAEPPPPACVTPTDVVQCDDSNFYWFRVASEEDGGLDKHPIWLGGQCQITPCQAGDLCEVKRSVNFDTGVCH